jgi:NADH-quinone oxidoreductase subunit N
VNAVPDVLATLAQADERIRTPSVDWGALAPMLILVGGATVLLMVSGLLRRQPPAGSYSLFTVIVAGASVVAAVPLWDEVQDPDRGPFSAVSGAVGIDGFSVFFTIIIGMAVILAALLADGYLRREGLDGAELYVLMMLSASGGLIMAAANDLIVMFLGLEILSIAVYVLAAMHLRRVQSQEAGMKYFVLGAFSSAFFLYGIALVYGATGTTNLGRILERSVITFESDGEVVSQVTSAPSALLLAGMALLLVGFGFKVAAVPFHAWTPDVYQGAPSPVVAFMASGVKAAGFAGLMRVFVDAFSTYAPEWQPYVYVLAVLTLLVGSVLAVVQTDVKRMLAYSSISHAGFILVGVQAASDEGVAGALFYLAAYTFMVAGSFGVVTVVGRRGDDRHSLDDYGGLARTSPVLAFAFTVLLLAQAGVPLTAGFFAKFYVLAAAIDAESYWLAIIAMVATVIAAFVYLRIIVAMYMADEDEEPAPAEPAVATAGAGVGPGAMRSGELNQTSSMPSRIHVPFAAALTLTLSVIFTLVVGFLPSSVAEVTRDATSDVLAPGPDD